MDSRQIRNSRAHARRTMAWWLIGSVLLLAGLWAGPQAWAAELSSCGQATVPGPCAVDDGIGTAFATAVTIPVLANDEDRSGTGLRVTAVTTAAHGTVVRNADNTVTYTPAGGFSGADEFHYTVKDGLSIAAVASVMVFVAAQAEQIPNVQPVDPLAGSVAAFSNPVSMDDGARAAMTTTIQLPSGAFSLTLQPHDALAIVFQPVVTPTGNVNAPPDVLLSVQPGGAAGSSAAKLGYRWTRISFWLDVLLNGVSLSPMALRKPLTFEVSYGTLLQGYDEQTLTPYYWTGSTWTKEGIDVVSRNGEADKITFTVDRIAGEMSFFARSNLLFMPVLRAR